MIKKKFLKKVAIGLSIAALFIGTANIGTAFAQSGGGTSSASRGTVNPQDSELFEKQREMDMFLFVDNIKEIEEMGFQVIYTGVSDSFVEVGITPYNDEYAAYLYDEFGTEIVKVVDTEEVVIYDTPVEAPDAMPIDADKNTSLQTPIMDMGDTPVSNDSDDEAHIKEREQLMADEEEKLTIQIESIGGSEPADSMDPESIWQTDIVEDLPNEDIGEDDSDDGIDTGLVTAEDDMMSTTSANNIENEDKGLPTASLVAIVVGGILIIGGTAYVSAKKRLVKKD